MTFTDYQQKAMRTSRTDMSKDAHLFNGILGLAGESGECADLMKKHYYQDGREIYNDLIDELGDVLWYVAEAANALDVTLDSIAQHNVEKLRRRFPNGFDPERSLHREEYE